MSYLPVLIIGGYGHICLKMLEICHLVKPQIFSYLSPQGLKIKEYEFIVHNKHGRGSIKHAHGNCFKTNTDPIHQSRRSNLCLDPML